ncbi:MAG TPA: carboxymuconolactone decarboxylase family protein [Vicinamibacterales bacterium]
MTSRTVALVLVFVFGVSALAVAQTATGDSLPRDVSPDSRNRLPLLKPDVQGVAAIRLHASGVDVRWNSPLGRQLTELAILTAAREHDQPYEWSLHEMEALAVGLDPAVIDVVRHRRPLAGLAEKQAIIVEIGRDVFDKHTLGPATFARALKILGKPDLVDIVSLMANYAATATRLTAFNQQMPPTWKQLLPLPFMPPSDIHADSRSRLPYVKAQTQATPGPLYSRGLAPEGTGPGHIGRHGSGMKLLEAGVGRRLMALAVLVTAREHHHQYHWTMSEIAARKDGLDAAAIDVVRHGRPLGGLAEKDAALIQFGRELFGNHTVSADTYARALKIFGERDLVDLVDLMARQVADVTLLTAFDQHLPAGEKPLLPER